MMRRALSLALATLACAMFADSGPVLAGPRADYVQSTDGVRIYYQVAGVDSTPLVFVHGWSCDSTYWNEQVAHFARRHLVVTVDLAGHGESGSNRRSWTIGAFGEDVVAAVKKLRLQSAILIGHSMGGPVVIEAATRVPDQVVGVIGVDTLHDLNPRLSPERSTTAMAPFERDFPSAMDGFVRRLFRSSADSLLVDRIAADMSSGSAAVGIAAGRAYWSWWGGPSKTTFRRLRAPLAVINTDMFPTKSADNKTVVPSFRARILRDAGHFLMIEQPETFNRLLEETIMELSP